MRIAVYKKINLGGLVLLIGERVPQGFTLCGADAIGGFIARKPVLFASFFLIQGITEEVIKLFLMSHELDNFLIRRSNGYRGIFILEVYSDKAERLLMLEAELCDLPGISLI